jgi:class 3 adenylate cyclase
VAQVKLIGDCIFLFIEDEAATDGATPADLALELAALLVKETELQNARRREAAADELHFGVAIHYGEVVVGNLSSDSCIDYTVIGPNVNLVARLEELTKNVKIAEQIGTNGIIVSCDAAAGLSRYRDVALLNLRLDTLGVSVRSFPQVTAVAGLSAEAARNIRRQAMPESLRKAG